MYSIEKDDKGKYMLMEDDRPLVLSHYLALQKVLNLIGDQDEDTLSEGIQYYRSKCIVSIFTGTSKGKVDEFTRDAVLSASYHILESISNTPEDALQTSFIHNEKEYKAVASLINKKDMTFGQYIDAESALTAEDFMELLSVLWRNVDEEKYTGDIPSFEDFPYHAAAATITAFQEYRYELTERFESLYSSEGGGGMNKSNFDMFSESWGWIGKVDALAHGDILKWDSITELTVDKVMVKLTLDNDKAKAQSADHKIQERAESVM